MIDTGTFVAGVGVLVSMQLLALTQLYVLSRQVGTDELARTTAEDAHNRIDEYHEVTDGGEPHG